MDEWWRRLTGRPFYWVLDGSYPPAELFMLRYVVERPERARATEAARLALREWPPVEALRASLGAEGGWGPRYGAPLWRLRLLAELGVPGDDERIAAPLDRALDEREGAAMPSSRDLLLLHSALAFGFHDDERVQHLVAGVAAGLAGAPPDWLLLAAMALAELPEAARDGGALAQLAERLRALEPGAFPHFARYGFPTYDQPDDLVLAGAALRLGIGGAWLEPWVERVVAAQDGEGLWRLGRRLPAPEPLFGEAEGAPSRWISARALYVLREFYGE